MKLELLQAAREKVQNPMVLVNVISRRMKQLNQGFRPMVNDPGLTSNVDVVLKEIADGVLQFEHLPLEEEQEKLAS